MERSRRSISFTKSLGAAHLGFLRKRMLRQAPPSDVVAIVVLELCCLLVKDDFLRGCAGFCFCALYGRLRVSDCNRQGHEYFEGSLCRVKTARTLEKQTRFLPVILPMRGLLGFAWCEHVVEARQSMGLESIPEREEQDREERFILFPSQRSWLDFLLGRMGAAERTERLYECLGRVLPKEHFQHYTSHCLTCAILMHANIFGLSLEQNELCDDYAPRSKNGNIHATICRRFPFCQQDHGGAHYAAICKECGICWETMAEFISDFTLHYGDAAFTEWFYGETAIRKRSQLWVSWQTMWKEWDLSHARCQFWRWRRVRIEWLW